MANPSKVLSIVSAIQSFGNGVYQVDFTVPARTNRFLPGQFLHLTLDDYDPSTGYWPESRVFSIASEPKQDFLSIVYSVKGMYTKRMEAELSIGKEIWLKYPYGDFILDNHVSGLEPVVMIAGGTGVAPYMPYLLNAQKVGLKSKHTLYYGIRETNHLLFKNYLLAAGNELPNFNLYLYLEHGNMTDFSNRAGRLNIQAVQEDQGTLFKESIYFLSGPPAMINKFKADLITASINEEQIKIDDWE